MEGKNTNKKRVTGCCQLNSDKRDETFIVVSNDKLNYAFGARHIQSRDKVIIKNDGNQFIVSRIVCAKNIHMTDVNVHRHFK